VKLSIPFTWSGETWVEVEYGKPSVEVMADARAIADTGDFFSTVLTFLAGVVRTITSASGKVETDKGQIKNILREMPAGNTDHVSLMALGQGGNDLLEGYYKCPRCGKALVCEGDQADSLEDLEVIESEPDPVVERTLVASVSVTNRATKEELLCIESVSLHHPTLRDYIQAFGASGKDRIRQQYGAYANALISINSKPVDDKFKRQYGAWAFGKMMLEDVNAIAEQILSVGLQRTLEKHCAECGKVWPASVSTSGFFVSALGEQ
jgi:hypothetical protein